MMPTLRTKLAIQSSYIMGGWFLVVSPSPIYATVSLDMETEAQHLNVLYSVCMYFYAYVILSKGRPFCLYLTFDVALKSFSNYIRKKNTRSLKDVFDEPFWNYKYPKPQNMSWVRQWNVKCDVPLGSKSRESGLKFSMHSELYLAP